MSRAKPKRKCWQFHLSTAIISMLAAGVMIWLNLVSFNADGPSSIFYPNLQQMLPDANAPIADNQSIKVTWHDQGWPLTYRHYFLARPPISAESYWVLGVNGFALYADLGIAIVIIFIGGFGIEYFIRRREARKT